MEDLLTPLAALASPFVVEFLTNGVKRLQAVKYSNYRKVVLRFAAVVFAFGATLATGLADGTEIDPASIDTLVQGLMTFGAATGIYLFKKKQSSK